MGNRRKRWACGLTVLLLSAAAPGAPDLLPAEGLTDAGLWRYWQVGLPLSAGESVTAIHQVEENLYAVTDRGVVFAVHADSGVIRWAEQVILPGGKVFAPTHRVARDGERQVVIATATHVRLYSVAYGDSRGSLSLPFAPSTAAVADAERIYVGSVNHRFYCYRLADGIRIWHVRSTAPMRTTPTLHGEDLCFASQSGRIYVCRARDKRARWTARIDTAIHGDLAVDENFVYVAGQDRYVRAFERGGGTETWRRQLPAPLFHGPILVGDTLYQLADEAGVYALEPKTGAVRWSYEPTSRRAARGGVPALRFVARGGERVYFVDHTGGGIVLNNTTGERTAQFEAAAADLALANPVDETLFFASRGGVLICVRRRGAPALRRAMPERVATVDGAPTVVTTQPAKAAAVPKATASIDELVGDPFRSRTSVRPLVGRTEPNAPAAGEPPTAGDTSDAR